MGDLGDNQLTSLPESFGNLVALQELGLFRNQLTTLPESFGNLVALQGLGLFRNQLTSLPESFSNLVTLQGLGCWQKQLTRDTLMARFCRLIRCDRWQARRPVT